MKVTYKKPVLTAMQWDGTDEGLEQLIAAFDNVNIVKGDIAPATNEIRYAIISAYDNDINSLLNTVVITTDKIVVEDMRHGIMVYPVREFNKMFYEVPEEGGQ